MKVELALKEHEGIFDLDVHQVAAAAPVAQEAACTLGVRCETRSISR
ncbi:hypothetical protein [Streptomyces chattanoogensis]|nr:hypothetical protein [Streptomyces chattanoogensis]